MALSNNVITHPEHHQGNHEEWPSDRTTCFSLALAVLQRQADQQIFTHQRHFAPPIYVPNSPAFANCQPKASLRGAALVYMFSRLLLRLLRHLLADVGVVNGTARQHHIRVSSVPGF